MKTREQIDRLEAECAAIGRDPGTIRRSVLSWRSGAFESWDAMTEWVGTYLDMGFDEVILFWPGDPHADELVDRVAGELFPALRQGADARTALRS